MDIDLENFITWKAMMDDSVDIASFKKFVKFSKLKTMQI